MAKSVRSDEEWRHHGCPQSDTIDGAIDHALATDVGRAAYDRAVAAQTRIAELERKLERQDKDFKSRSSDYHATVNKLAMQRDGHEFRANRVERELADAQAAMLLFSEASAVFEKLLAEVEDRLGVIEGYAFVCQPGCVPPQPWSFRDPTCRGHETTRARVAALRKRLKGAGT